MNSKNISFTRLKYKEIPKQMLRLFKKHWADFFESFLKVQQRMLLIYLYKSNVTSYCIALYSYVFSSTFCPSNDTHVFIHLRIPYTVYPLAPTHRYLSYEKNRRREQLPSQPARLYPHHLLPKGVFLDVFGIKILRFCSMLYCIFTTISYQRVYSCT